MEQNEAVLTMKHIQVRRGSFLLQDINLDVFKREIFAVLGKTGAGKSVLLETAAGFHTPEEGEVSLHGQNLLDLPIFKRNIGYLYQDYSLFPHMTAGTNIGFGLRMRGINKKEIQQRVEEIASQFGISSLLETYPGTLSGGEQQRVVIARALLNTPEMILADEPTGNLDAETGREIMDLLYAISQAGITVLMSTHNTNWPEQYPGQKWIFENGEIKA